MFCRETVFLTGFFFLGPDFLVIPIIFYIVVAAARLDLDTLRMEHWLLDAGKTSHMPWYHYYSYLGALFLMARRYFYF
jgi:hypothetical protein